MTLSYISSWFRANPREIARTAGIWLLLKSGPDVDERLKSVVKMIIMNQTVLPASKLSHSSNQHTIWGSNNVSIGIYLLHSQL